jgi:hypothetical protein
MKPITFVKKGDTLYADRTSDREELDSRLGDGEVITTDLKPSVDRTGNARFWAVVGKAFKAAGSDWKTAEDLADAAKIAAGHAVLTRTLRGKPYLRARSLSEVGDWDIFTDTVINKLADSLNLDQRLLRDDGSATNSPPAKVADPDYSPKSCMDKFIDLGITRWDDEEEKFRMIDQIKVSWMRHIDDLGFVYKCAEVAIKLSKGQMNEPDARRLLAAQLPQ